MLYYLRYRPLALSWKWKAIFEPWFKLLGFDCGSRDGAVVRVLPSHQCELGLNPGPVVTWIEFVISSHPCSKRFSLGPPVFLLQRKTNILNSNSTWQKWTGRATPWIVQWWNPFIYFLCTAIHACFAMFGRIFVVSHWNSPCAPPPPKAL